MGYRNMIAIGSAAAPNDLPADSATITCVWGMRAQLTNAANVQGRAVTSYKDREFCRCRPLLRRGDFLPEHTQQGRRRDQADCRDLLCEGELPRCADPPNAAAAIDS